jgi:hypothetical protein
MRALGRALGKLVGFAVVAAIAICLYMIGANVYSYFTDGPWTPADQAQPWPSLVTRRSIPVRCAIFASFSASRSMSCIRAARSTSRNIAGIAAQCVCALPATRRSVSRSATGKFLDLKVGGPAPSPEAAAALRKHAVECCQAAQLQWRASSGRVTWIDFQRKVMRPPGY